MIISICGKSGSGKSTLTNELLKHFGDNAIHIDVDKIGHYVNTIPEVLNEEVKCFGEGIKTNGIVDRKKLGKIVFSSNEEMNKLIDITWKYMEKEMEIHFLKLIKFNSICNVTFYFINTYCYLLHSISISYCYGIFF